MRISTVSCNVRLVFFSMGKQRCVKGGEFRYAENHASAEKLFANPVVGFLVESPQRARELGRKDDVSHSSQHPSLMDLVGCHVGLFHISHDQSQSRPGMLKGIPPPFQGCLHELTANARFLPQGILHAVDAVFGEVHPVLEVKKPGEFIGVYARVQQGVVFIVPHGGGGIDTAP
jgi:hypothetical protein